MNTRTHIALIVALLLVLAGPGWGTTYYVDSGAAAGGTGTYDLPFDTLADVDAVAVSGDVICLSQGSVFREDLDLSNLDNIVLKAYGDGSTAMPQVLGDLVIANAVWSLTGGTTNVYQYQLSQVPNDMYPTVFEDGVQLQIVADTSTCDATPGSYTLDDVDDSTSPGTRTFYVHASDSSAVTLNGKTYSVTDVTRTGKVSVRDGCTIQHIAFGRPGHQNGNVVAGKNTTLRGCMFVQDVIHQCLVQSGEMIDCIGLHTADDFRTTAGMLEFFIADGTGLTGTYRRCIAIGSGYTAGQVVVGFFGHNAGAGTYYDSIALYDCVVTNGARVSWAANYLRIERLRTNGQGITVGSFDAAEGVDLVDVWIDGSAAEISRAIQQYAGTTAPIRGDGVRIYYGTGASTHYGVMDCANANFSQSVFAQVGVPFRYYITYCWTGLASLGFDACVFTGGSESKTTFYRPYNGALTTSDNNVFTATGFWQIGDGAGGTATYNTLAEIQAATALEAHSIEADPQLTDPANGDFSIGNPTVAALAVGLDADSLAVTYTAIPSEAAILQFDWPGSGGGTSMSPAIFGGSILK